MRSDASLNRLRILAAAAEVLAAGGDSSLKSIARRAGVGQGTLYRHFPTRESLVLEVYWQEVDEMVTAVPVLLDTLCPRLALRAWLDRLLMLGRSTPELAGAMRAATAALTEACREPYRPLMEAMTALVGANEAARTIVPGTTADDVLLLLGPLWHVGAREEDRARAERLFEVLMRGLCPSAAAQAG
ncbi:MULTISPECIES: TetR/AcrR family transcriptional regulator [Streptomyces]|uniref:TetR/AcrR family transcriptional regulator n=1 Tax=Streptomyces TaxID=1883 RepID=UPI0023DD5C20|nr:TetR/AcrR family transcriptional regulator [Streptomyces sp. FXJ1.172]WEP00819.1 helix-turn-helix domain containing protein [Streptomyces sp. FXJ1.172]